MLSAGSVTLHGEEGAIWRPKRYDIISCFLIEDCKRPFARTLISLLTSSLRKAALR
jgi:hypothetical protein